jgi:FkbM family methyltransferase
MLASKMPLEIAGTVLATESGCLSDPELWVSPASMALRRVREALRKPWHMKPFFRRMFRNFGYELRRLPGPECKIWIDVGAHAGQHTLQHAQKNSQVLVYAFEPDWRMLRSLVGKAVNFVPIPMAVSEADGIAEFFINMADGTSSLLPFNPDAFVAGWKESDGLFTERRETVPTIRLDTFMSKLGIDSVEYLKIDAQGADLMVVRSLGERLKDIQSLTLEVDVSPVRAYKGSSGKEEIVDFLLSRGFDLVRTRAQTSGREENLDFVRMR